MGGNSPAAPPPVVDNSAEIELQRQQAENARRAQEQAERRTAFENAKKGSYTAAENQARSVIGSKGLSTDEFMPLILNELNRVQTTIPDLDPSPGSYYGPTLAEDVLNREQGNRRTKFGQQVESNWAPGWQTSVIADTMDDPYLEAIKQSQYNAALQTLQRGQARGTLSDNGYNAAIQALNDKNSAAMSRLQQIGGGILNTGRGELGSIVDKAKTGASNYTLGSQFSLDPYKTEFDTKKSGFESGLEGQVKGATEGLDLYGVNDILAGAARNQGVAGNNAGLADVLASRKKNENSARGLGSTGAF